MTYPQLITRNPPSRPHILLIDDDPMFRTLFAQAADKLNIQFSAVSSLRELEPFAQEKSFDIAVVDYFLDGVHENLTGLDVASFMGSTPVLLVSNSDHCVAASEVWPEAIRKFVPKRVGVAAILRSAVDLWVGHTPPEFSNPVAA